MKKAAILYTFKKTTMKNPKRRCVGCREMKDKASLVRVTANADGKISLDRSGKAAGRGAYVCKNPECLQKAQKSKGFERSLKRAVPSEIYDALGR
jgi:hypothetical protein